MKCGSCRDPNAENYKKIKEEDSLFEIITSLNPRRAYNAKYSYFCDVCINLASAELAQKMSTISDQNPNSYTALNTSTSTTSSKDEYDYMVTSKYVFSDTGTPMINPARRSVSKRAAQGTQKQRPCPKRFKKPFTPIQEDNYREATAVEETLSQQRSSESIKENDVLLNLGLDTSSGSTVESSQSIEQQFPTTSYSQQAEDRSPTTNRSQHDSPSLQSKGARNQQKVPPYGPSVQGTVKANPKASDKSLRKSLLQYDSDSPSSEDTRNQRTVPTNVPSVRGTVETNPKASEKSRPKSVQYDSDSMSSGDTSNQRTVPTNVPSVSGAVKTNLKASEKSRPETLLQNDSDSSSSKDTRNQPTVPTKVPSVSGAVKTNLKASEKSRPQTLRLPYDSDSSDASNLSNRQAATVHDSVQAPTAPAARNPRTRLDASNMPTEIRPGIRQYFSTQNFDVSNYSRSLAG